MCGGTAKVASTPLTGKRGQATHNKLESDWRTVVRLLRAGMLEVSLLNLSGPRKILMHTELSRSDRRAGPPFSSTLPYKGKPLYGPGTKFQKLNPGNY